MKEYESFKKTIFCPGLQQNQTFLQTLSMPWHKQPWNASEKKQGWRPQFLCLGDLMKFADANFLNWKGSACKMTKQWKGATIRDFFCCHSWKWWQKNRIVQLVFMWIFQRIQNPQDAKMFLPLSSIPGLNMSIRDSRVSRASFDPACSCWDS